MYQTDYSTKLQLGSLRALVGFDKMRGFHSNPRTTFKGGARHAALSTIIFPWIEGVRETTELCSTAKVFVDLLEKLRRVLIHYCAILIGKHESIRIFCDMI